MIIIIIIIIIYIEEILREKYEFSTLVMLTTGSLEEKIVTYLKAKAREAAPRKRFPRRHLVQLYGQTNLLRILENRGTGPKLANP